ncbi:hypothetical protein [Granulosicoccus antarcticus]|nr:hypothetical protein [Granulosicoccus antarcticus]
MALCSPVASYAGGLDAAEQQLAETLSNQVLWPTESEQKLVSHPLGTQTLFIESQESKKRDQERKARVYQYDYNRQAARLLVIELDKQTVTRTSAIDSVHLPLNQTEIDFAIAMLADNALIIEQLRAEQSNRGVHPFDFLSELDVKASIFEPLDSNHPCAIARCALLSLFDASSTVFSIEPIAFLNSQQIGLLQQR